MKLLVVGASRGVGLASVRDASRKGHDVTAVSRSGQGEIIENVLWTAGNVMDARDMDRVVKGHEAVIFTVGASIGEIKKNPDIFSLGITNVVTAMKRHKIKRLIVLSAVGVAESVEIANFIYKIIAKTFFKRQMVDHGRQEEIVKNSYGIEWVIVRPTMLRDDASSGSYTVTPALEPVPPSIARADVASFMVAAAENDAHENMTVHLGGM